MLTIIVYIKAKPKHKQKGKHIETDSISLTGIFTNKIYIITNKPKIMAKRGKNEAPNSGKDIEELEIT